MDFILGIIFIVIMFFLPFLGVGILFFVVGFLLEDVDMDKIPNWIHKIFNSIYIATMIIAFGLGIYFAIDAAKVVF